MPNTLPMSVIDAMTATVAGSDSGAMPFPEVVRRLAEVGVESYYADLRRAERIFFMPDGRSRCIASRLSHDHVAQTFSPEGVKAAITEIQNRRIDYPAFCERIAAAGCCAYSVSLLGRRAVYMGRSGEIFVEHFPSQP
jgi:uncharacterized protein YbcV (DUF1398 family)